MLQMLDQVFWNLPFASAKQATVVRKKFNYPEADWQAKSKELEKEHNADGARDQLQAGWLQWLGGAACQTASAWVVLAILATPVIDDDA
jgi:hypothetical protein